MRHLKELRKAIVQKIKDENIPDVGTNVYMNRSAKWWPEETTSVCVYNTTTDFQGEDRQPRWMQGGVLVVVEVIVQGPKADPLNVGQIIDVQDQLDDVGQGILDALIYPWDSEIGASSQGPLGGLADDTILVRIETELDGEGEVEKGAQRIYFRYDIQELLPSIAPPDKLERVSFGIKADPDANAEKLDIEETIILHTP